MYEYAYDTYMLYTNLYFRRDFAVESNLLPSFLYIKDPL